ncbi:hypothetical protein [Salinibacter ruber]|uniref:Uncharacterized protein n=1 Tax=Salinibacter ruber TaxID=146919 RepID=A0AAW5P8P5_9BACT|nr:hypothetical protein [Salinibacter ruber]MCS4157737.1 hypothetical protein [Salinibacter ruber]
MSLPGDRDIDTDPVDEVGAHQRIHDVCDRLEGTFQALIAVRRILTDPDASAAAQGLAERVLREKTRGLPTVLDHIRSQATRLQEEIDTLNHDK